MESPGKSILKALLIGIGATVGLLIALALIILIAPEQSRGAFMGVAIIVFLIAVLVPTIRMNLRNRKAMLEIEKKHMTGELSEEEYQKVQSNQNKRYMMVFALVILIVIFKIVRANM